MIKKRYNFLTLKMLKHGWNMFCAFKYLWWGRWETSKFFVDELLELFELYAWYTILYPLFSRLLFSSAFFFWYVYDLYLDLQTLPLINLYFGAVVLDICEDKNYKLDSPIAYVTPCLIDINDDFDFVSDFDHVSNYYLSDSLTLLDEDFLKHGVLNKRFTEEVIKRWKRKSSVKELKKLFDPDELLDSLEENNINFSCLDMIEDYLYLVDLQGLIKMKTNLLPIPIVYNFVKYDTFYNLSFDSDTLTYFGLSCYMLVDFFLLDDVDDLFWEWLNTAFIIWSFIVKYISDRVRNLFFFYFYYYFPVFEYVPKYVQAFSHKFYFWLKFIYNKVLIGSLFYTVPLPLLWELGLEEILFIPKSQQTPPWVVDFFLWFFNFSIKPLSVNQQISGYLNSTDNFFSLTEAKFLPLFDYPYYFVNALTHNIVKWLITTNFYHLEKIFETYIFESVPFFFSWKTWHITKRFLTKWIIKKKTKRKTKFNFLFLANDFEFFWPINSDFEVSRGPYRLLRRRGWPKKLDLFYFTFEAEIFEDQTPWEFIYTNWDLCEINMWKLTTNTKKAKNYFVVLLLDKILFSSPVPF